jgi:polyhydroxybutyrate depolymerase
MSKYLILLFSVFLFISCEKDDTSAESIIDNDWTTKQFTFEHDGLTRTYILHKPKDFIENSPLVFVLHGFGSSAMTIMSYSQMNTLADQNGFMVCYPQGSTLATGQTHWNANLEMSSINDIDFLTQLAKKIQFNYKINLENTFTSGMSNGGFMSYTLGCEKSDVFKAIASITGTMSRKDWENCAPAFKIPALQISGTNDTTVPWDGTMSTAYGWGGAPHILKVMDFWAEFNSTTKTEKIDFPDIDSSDKSTVSLTKRKEGINNNEVWLYTVTGGGHDWPGSWGNKDISASSEIWKFFKQHLK